jgi:hypothetical protein
MQFITCHQGFGYLTEIIIDYLSGLEAIIGYSCLNLDHEVIELVLLYIGWWLASFLTIMYSFNQFLFWVEQPISI